jgi:hypothetical protein
MGPSFRWTDAMTADPTYLARVVSIVDTLDPPAVPELSLRDQLITSTQELCQAQGLSVTPAAIAAAVDQNLAAGSAVTPPMDVDYGWKRPATMAALQAERTRLNRWWRKLFRPAPDTNRDLALFLIFGVVSAVLTGIFVSHPWAPLIGWHGVSVLGPVGLLLMTTLGVHDYNRSLALAVPNEVSFNERLDWQERRAARVRIRHCFRSPLGVVLNGDVTVIRREVAQADRDWKTQCVERERAYTQQQLSAMLSSDN